MFAVVQQAKIAKAWANFNNATRRGIGAKPIKSALWIDAQNLHYAYTKHKIKRPTPKDWPKLLI